MVEKEYFVGADEVYRYVEALIYSGVERIEIWKYRPGGREGPTIDSGAYTIRAEFHGDES